MGRKKKDETKIKYIINKIDSVAEYYSKNTQSNQELKKKIEKMLYVPLSDRRSILVNNFEDIKMLKINGENYNFTYSTEGFDRFVARFTNAQISMIKDDNSEEYFTKESYTELMKRFAEYRKFLPFVNKYIIHDRF